MTDNKLDYLWKKSKGVATTSVDKEPHNESIKSYDPIFQDQIWVRTERLPKPSPTVKPVPIENWNDDIIIHLSTDAVKLKRDLSSRDGSAWIALRDPLLNYSDTNVLKDWIPPRFHPTYRVKVYAGDPASQTETPIRLWPDSTGSEWEFDYAAGVLFFYDGVPQVALDRGIWIEGWRYVGSKGGGLTKDDLAPSYTGTDFTVNVPQLESEEFYDFNLQTGGSCTLVLTTVDAPAIVECHSQPGRDDTNPYRFVSTVEHLVDDGSYTVAGRRVYGPRFVVLQNLYKPEDGVTYWRIYNDSDQIRQITVTVRAIPRV
jgi:hypothetical protein